jgi:hypothetical protein
MSVVVYFLQGQLHECVARPTGKCESIKSHLLLDDDYLLVGTPHVERKALALLNPYLIEKMQGREFVPACGPRFKTMKIGPCQLLLVVNYFHSTGRPVLKNRNLRLLRMYGLIPPPTPLRPEPPGPRGDAA